MEARLQLLDAALRMLATHGYHAVGLRDVAARVGMTTGAIYHHFDSKEDLLRQAVDHFAARIIEEQEQLAGSSQGAASHLRALATWLVADGPGERWRRDFIVVASVELHGVTGFAPLYRQLRHVFRRVVRQPLARGVAGGELRLPGGTSLDEMVTLMVAGFVGVLQVHARGALEVPLDRALDLHVDTVLHAMSPHRAPVEA